MTGIPHTECAAAVSGQFGCQSQVRYFALSSSFGDKGPFITNRTSPSASSYHPASGILSIAIPSSVPKLQVYQYSLTTAVNIPYSTTMMAMKRQALKVGMISLVGKRAMSAGYLAMVKANTVASLRKIRDGPGKKIFYFVSDHHDNS